MKVAFKLLVISAVLVATVFSSAYSQCESWVNTPRSEEAENAHVIYRPFVKGKLAEDLLKLSEADFNLAFSNWETAFKLAPAADGQRDWHFTDGAAFYLAKFKKETDAAKKQEYAQKVIDLYKGAVKCVESGAIKTTRPVEEHAGLLMGDLGFHMFYSLNSPYSQNLEVFEEAYARAGNAVLYNMLEPAAHIAVFQFENDAMDKDKARELYDKVIAIAERNMENNKAYGEYYEQSRDRFKSVFAKIENDVFDCDYFKEKLLPEVEKAPDDLEVIRYVFAKLRQQGCDSTDAVVVDLRQKYESLAAEINAQLELERRKNNPGYDASILQREGKYSEAVARYRDAIEQTDDPEAKAQFYYSIAFIQTWQFNQYQSARDNAQRAASLKSRWGKPYILIGDMYAKSSRSCGDDWDSRMAIIAAIEKYAYARSIDSSVADEANERIGRFSSSLPERQEGFMRGYKGGETVRVGCWIGENVTIRYQ